MQGIKDVCNKYLSVFNTCLSPEPALLPPMELDVDLEKWRRNANKGPPRQQTQTKQDEVHKQISKMLPTKVVSTSQAEYYSQVHLTPKPVHSVTETSTSDLQIHSAVQIALGWRFCVDFRNLNMASTGMGWPIPNIQQMFVSRRFTTTSPIFIYQKSTGEIYIFYYFNIFYVCPYDPTVW